MEQMSSLVDNPDFSDCEIFFPKENKIIRAHKALLAIRSERFDVMFKYVVDSLNMLTLIHFYLELE